MLTLCTSVQVRKVLAKSVIFIMIHLCLNVMNLTFITRYGCCYPRLPISVMLIQLRHWNWKGLQYNNIQTAMIK
jgi:hypothetical protein